MTIPTPDESGELKPCPFCGVHLIETHRKWVHPLGASQVCAAHYVIVPDAPEMIERWNRRSTDTRTEVLAEKPVTRPMVEFMAELRENREAEVRAAAIEEAAKVADEGVLIFDGGPIKTPTDMKTIASMTAKVIAAGIRALKSQPSREVRGEK